jgi:Transposase
MHKSGFTKSRFTEEQIINILKSVETGQRVTDACRTHGIACFDD